MNLYRITYPSSDEANDGKTYRRTLKEAQNYAKDMGAMFDRESIRVQLLSMPTSSDNIIDAINGVEVFTILREWRLTPRLGLKDVNEPIL